jgi:hypothetical protein
MNVDGSFVKRPRWLRVKESEDLINAMDIQWVHPYLNVEKSQPIIVKKKCTVTKIYSGLEIVKKLKEEGFVFKDRLVSIEDLELMGLTNLLRSNNRDDTKTYSQCKKTKKEAKRGGSKTGRKDR